MKGIATLTALAAVAAFAVSAPAQAQEIRYSLWAQPGEAQYDGAVEFKRVVEEGSKGRLKVTLYPGDQLGTPRELFAQLAVNTTQISASGDPGLKEIEYLALPYLMKGIKNYVAFMDTPYGQKLNEKLTKERRLRILGFMPRNPRQISANKVINTMADLKGLKLRSPERDYYVKSLAALGANPTPMAFGEVYTGLQTGIVDGQENPIETIYAQKFYEVQKCIAMVDYIDKPAYVVISELFWSSLSADDQKLLQRANDASNVAIVAAMPKQQEQYIKEMKAAGITFTYPDKKEFVAATQSVRDELGLKSWGKEAYAEIVKIGQQDL
ncbi:TRAP transporter substrate-binding protein [Shumkonia mesophila]|uniref:TRAP transporter substrate-binding protein n=1 Tax=Shumkonia mesophila TaxID=2838854 RepID=UPI002934C1D1|nr:TRAP transporter substrate-binding protein [Shumkonia mesophila]